VEIHPDGFILKVDKLPGNKVGLTCWADEVDVHISPLIEASGRWFYRALLTLVIPDPANLLNDNDRGEGQRNGKHAVLEFRDRQGFVKIADDNYPKFDRKSYNWLASVVTAVYIAFSEGNIIEYLPKFQIIGKNPKILSSLFVLILKLVKS